MLYLLARKGKWEKAEGEDGCWIKLDVRIDISYHFKDPANRNDKKKKQFLELPEFVIRLISTIR